MQVPLFHAFISRNKDFLRFCMFLIFIITFEPNKMWTCSAPQNDRLNLSFVKNEHVVGQNIARYGLKWLFISCYFSGVHWTCIVFRLHLRPKLLTQSRFRPVKHLKMTVRTSVLWKINTYMAKKWPGMVVQRSFIKGHSFRNRV